jgi:hypothetical protein
MFGGGRIAPGPAYVTRSVKGHPWGGASTELHALVNRVDISRLVIFDTWTLNCDRHPPEGAGRRPNYDNVFIATVPNSDPMLMAMDHSHCFSCGRDLTVRLSRIDLVNDDRVFGLFPGFIEFMDRAEVERGCDRLRDFNVETLNGITASVPTEWQVPAPALEALAELLLRRAARVADGMLNWLIPHCWPQTSLDLTHGEPQ